jgi:hypothetical protein
LTVKPFSLACWIAVDALSVDVEKVATQSLGGRHRLAGKATLGFAPAGRQLAIQRCAAAGQRKTETGIRAGTKPARLATPFAGRASTCFPIHHLRWAHWQRCSNDGPTSSFANVLPRYRPIISKHLFESDRVKRVECIRLHVPICEIHTASTGRASSSFSDQPPENLIRTALLRTTTVADACLNIPHVVARSKDD